MRQLCAAFPIMLNHHWTAPIGGSVRLPASGPQLRGV